MLYLLQIFFLHKQHVWQRHVAFQGNAKGFLSMQPASSNLSFVASPMSMALDKLLKNWSPILAERRIGGWNPMLWEALIEGSYVCCPLSRINNLGSLFGIYVYSFLYRGKSRKRCQKINEEDQIHHLSTYIHVSEVYVVSSQTISK